MSPSPVAPRGAPRVLVVDDSAVAREILSAVLRSEGFEVATAQNAGMAATKIEQQRPDVLLLDIEMPGMNGLDFLENLMRTNPLPVIICSGVAQPGAVAAIRALELGAVDVIAKPSLGVKALATGAGKELAEVVRAAAKARFFKQRDRLPTPVLTRAITPHGLRAVGASAPAAGAAAPDQVAPPWTGHVVLIGASTGGTDAIREVLKAMPADSPPVVIVQHMPREYTGAFARRLNELSAMTVREAEGGETLVQGLALIAPGGRQLELVRLGTRITTRVYDGPLVSGHRPSVDVLFQSGVRTLGARAIAALLTGMGADGAQGLRALHDAGAETFAQDEASCVVFGMPKEAIALGAARQVLSLDQIARALASVAPSAKRV